MEREREVQFHDGAYPAGSDTSQRQNVKSTTLHTESQPLPKPSPEPNPNPEPQPEPELQQGLEPALETEVEPEQPVEMEVEPEVRSEPQPEPQSRPNSEVETQPRDKKCFRRFGTNAVGVLVGGTLLALGCLAFLCFLWFSDESNTAWRSIVVTDWLTRSITITSLILRWAVTAQAAVMTSMIAALLLQTYETPLTQAAAISLAVFSNTGPLEFLHRLPRTLDHRKAAFWSVMVLMTCTSTVLQFTSTMLLSDISSAVITDRVQLHMPYGMNWTLHTRAGAVEPRHYISTRSTSYPAFAEYAEPATQRDGVTDTGLSIRAFLPFDPQSNRQAAVGYTGAATLLDARVACMRPSFSGVEARIINSHSGLIAGTVWADRTVPRFNTSNGMGGAAQPAAFNCTFARRSARSDLSAAANEWPITICNIPFNSNKSQIVRDTGLVTELGPNPLSPPQPLIPGPIYLVVNTTGAYTDWFVFGEAPGTINITSQATTPVRDGRSEWRTLKTNVDGLYFVMTLCSMAPEARNTNITATRSHGVTEPQANWIGTEGTYDTRAVRTQLGITSPILPPRDRGIFSLAKKDSWLQAPYFVLVNYTNVTGWQMVPPDTGNDSILKAAFRDLPAEASYFDLNTFPPSNVTDDLAACGYCEAGSISMSRAHAAVFQDTIRETGSAAWAIQGLLTSLFGMSYYDHVFRFDVSAPANVATELAILRPTSWTFFTVVVVLVVFHLCLVCLVMTVFLRSAENAVLGGSWAAVARVSGPETDRWLATASTATDADIGRSIKRAGQTNVYVGLERFAQQTRLRQRRGVSAMIADG